jgi:dsRNA-specific ribonuclease
MSGAIEAVEESLNYSFKDASLLKLALTHPSFGSPNNQRLSFWRRGAAALRQHKAVCDDD